MGKWAGLQNLKSSLGRNAMHALFNTVLYIALFARIVLGILIGKPSLGFIRALLNKDRLQGLIIV
jgi:hypothetical protein